MHKMLKGIAAAALVAGFAATAHAETRPTPQASAPADATETKAAKETRYCVEDTMVGSRLPKKMCKTRAQWIAENDFDPLAPRQ